MTSSHCLTDGQSSCSKWLAERTLVPVPPNFRQEASVASVNSSPSPPGTLIWMEYPSPPRAQDKCCRSIKPHECPECGSVAHHFINWHPGPPRRPFVMGIKMERSTVSQPQQGIKHSAPSSRSWTFAPAPSVSTGLYKFQCYYLTSQEKLVLCSFLPKLYMPHARALLVLLCVWLQLTTWSLKIYQFC